MVNSPLIRPYFLGGGGIGGVPLGSHDTRFNGGIHWDELLESILGILEKPQPQQHAWIQHFSSFMSFSSKSHAGPGSLWVYQKQGASGEV